MLVWQDMVNGGTDYLSLFVTYLPSVFTGVARRIKDNAYGLFGRRDKEGRKLFYREMKEMITYLTNHPSIVMWVPFNEGWGQFDARKATWFTRRLDSTRLVNEASGWYDQGGGDVFSIHNYFRRLKVKPNKDRVVALTEYGGYAYRTEGHSFYDKVYGYRKYYSKEKLTNAFGGLLRRDVMGNIENGLSAAIYTQVSDIEEEVNGILTYDRKAVKLDEEKVKKWNERLYALVDRVYHGK
jgi:beta-galactosidase/beta-glucuronidase